MADELVKKCDNSDIIITNIKREIKSEKAPKLYDLTTLQRDANKAFGYTAQQTLDYTQSLYEGKLVTYPRTDSRYLSDDMAQTAFEVETACHYLFDLSDKYKPNFNVIINNSKVSGHHAIIPTVNIKTADIDTLPSGERNILKLIAVRLVCAAAPDHKYESVMITAKCADTEFTASGKSVLEPGWKEFVKSDKKEDKTIPKVSERQIFTAKASKGEHFTSPPKSFTEDTLLSAMERAGNENYDSETEKKGLGTPATRAAVIESLVKNGYAKREGKAIRATEKGKELISVVPDEVKSAKLTAEWENDLHLIECGNYSADSFMSEISAFISEMCKKYGTAVQSANLTEQSRKPVGRCPQCGGEVFNGKYGIYCKNKCGMNLTKVYGIRLSDEKVTDLLNGRQTYYTKNGRKTIVLPECAENPWNGKMYYQWKTEGKKYDK